MDEQIEKAEETAKNGASFLNRFMNAAKGGPDNNLYYIREAISWVLVFVVAFIAAILINMYLFRISDVSGNSMLNTYHDGQRVYLSKMPVVFSQIKRGDVIVFDHTKHCNNFFESFAESVKFNKITQLFMTSAQQSQNSHQFYIKRVIGVPGDTIKIMNNTVYVNDIPLKNEAYINGDEVPSYSMWEGVSWTVKENEYFVMGDNRNHSTDGRTLGTIPKGCILGVVFGGNREVVMEESK